MVDTGIIQIPLSRIGSADKFAAALEAHRAALVSHRTGEPDQPAPTGHELLDALILRVPDSGPVESRGPDRFQIAPYEIVDDTPPKPAPPSLADRKQALLIELHAAGQAAIDKLLSPARARLLGMEADDAAQTPKNKQTAAHKAMLKKLSAFRDRAAKINRVVTHGAVDIEDLTETTIGNWTVPAFD